MPKHKLKKFERTKAPSKFRISKTDLKILQDLADYRLLDSEQILALCPELSKRTLQRRLQLLFHAGFIDRPFHQSSYFKPSTYIIYALGRKGARLVFSDKRMSMNWTEKNRRIKPVFIWHTLMISDFRIALNLALRKKWYNQGHHKWKRMMQRQYRQNIVFI